MLNTNDLANDQAELENAKLILQLDRKIENLIKDEDNSEQAKQLNDLWKKPVLYQTSAMNMFRADMHQLQLLTFHPDPTNLAYEFPTRLYEEDQKLARKSPIWHSIFRDYYLTNAEKRLTGEPPLSVDWFIINLLASTKDDDVKHIFAKAYQASEYYRKNPRLNLIS